eukprot:TRINITY_DN1052_c0_g1_i2.p1 TRINITY_DN1052_c0_g1~~TRINITY_DN1052_c0_g1_i2.p1  ORF type:complete len:427 (-),score=77.91 TRINITY_DN1052_c0_g1_i2:297-1577(-)
MGNTPNSDLSPEQCESVLGLDVSVRAISEYIKAGRATNIVVIVGAGVSTSAGIPDFRTPGTGLYDNLEKYNLPSPEAMFDLEHFKEDPSAFYALAKELWPGRHSPTPTHMFLRLLQDKGLLLRCYTQNIDGLEREAGIDPERIVAAHGTFDSATCIATGQSVPVDELREAVIAGKPGWEALRDKHGGLVKPDLVFFGEKLPERFQQLAKEDLAAADLLIVLGTSLKVMPCAALVNRVSSTVPRLVIDHKPVGEEAGIRLGRCDNYRDVLLQASCDTGASLLTMLLGWHEDFQTLLVQHGLSLVELQDQEIASKNWRAPPNAASSEEECTDEYPAEWAQGTARLAEWGLDAVKLHKDVVAAKPAMEVQINLMRAAGLEHPWTCGACTVFNESFPQCCELCDAPNPQWAPALASYLTASSVKGIKTTI